MLSVYGNIENSVIVKESGKIYLPSIPHRMIIIGIICNILNISLSTWRTTIGILPTLTFLFLLLPSKPWTFTKTSSCRTLIKVLMGSTSTPWKCGPSIKRMPSPVLTSVMTMVNGLSLTLKSNRISMKEQKEAITTYGIQKRGRAK